MTDSFVIDIPSWEIGRIGIYTESVLRGVKPVAEIMIHNSQAVIVEEELRRAGVLWECASVKSTHTMFLIFIHEHLRQAVLRELGLAHNTEIFAHWVRGKMFGYTEDQIAVFCADQRSHFQAQ